MVEIGTILSFIQAFGIIVGVAYYILNIQNNRKNQELMLKAQQQTLETRQAQLLMQIFDKTSNRDYKEDFDETVWDWKFDSYEEYMTKYGSKPDTLSKLMHVVETLDGIGVLLENRLVDSKMLYRLLRWNPILCWEKYGPIIKEFGRRTGEPVMYPGFDFLYDELSRMYEDEHGYRYGHKVRSTGDALASLVDEGKDKSQ